jgi:hypothetical protein
MLEEITERMVANLLFDCSILNLVLPYRAQRRLVNDFARLIGDAGTVETSPIVQQRHSGLLCNYLTK